MIRITRSQLLPIGVDIGNDGVKLLQLEVVNASAGFGRHLAVVAAARHALPEEVRQQPQLRLPLAMDILRRVVRTSEFDGRHVVAALPRELVHVKNLRLPQMPLAELESAVHFEARNVFPFDIDSAQVRFLHAGEVRQGTDARAELIVLAAKNAEVNDYLEQLHRCGLIVESLDFEPAAIYRAVERYIRRREDEHEVHVLVDIGSRRSQVIIGRGKEISFYKTVDIGAQHLHEAVAKKLGVSVDEAYALRRRVIETALHATGPDAQRDPVRQAVFDASRSIMEELAREISLCLRYHSVTFRGHRPSSLRLTGAEAGDTHLQTVLGANLPLPVEAFRPLRNTDTARMKPADRVGPMSEWTTAFGLALKATTTYFGDREGKKRDPNSPRHDTRAHAGAEVVDLTKAVEGDPSVASIAAAMSANNGPAPRENPSRSSAEVARA